MGDAEAQQVPDGPLGQLVAAVGIGRVDFIPAMSLDLDPRVPGNRKQGRPLIVRVHHHDEERVAAPRIPFAGVRAQDDDIRLTRQQSLRRVVAPQVPQSPARSGQHDEKQRNQFMQNPPAPSENVPGTRGGWKP